MKCGRLLTRSSWCQGENSPWCKACLHEHPGVTPADGSKHDSNLRINTPIYPNKGTFLLSQFPKTHYRWTTFWSPSGRNQPLRVWSNSLWMRRRVYSQKAWFDGMDTDSLLHIRDTEVLIINPSPPYCIQELCCFSLPWLTVLIAMCVCVGGVHIGVYPP